MKIKNLQRIELTETKRLSIYPRLPYELVNGVFTRDRNYSFLSSVMDRPLDHNYEGTRLRSIHISNHEVIQWSWKPFQRNDEPKGIHKLLLSDYLAELPNMEATTFKKVERSPFQSRGNKYPAEPTEYEIHTKVGKIIFVRNLDYGTENCFELGNYAKYTARTYVHWGDPFVGKIEKIGAKTVTIHGEKGSFVEKRRLSIHEFCQYNHDFGPKEREDYSRKKAEKRQQRELIMKHRERKLLAHDHTQYL